MANVVKVALVLASFLDEASYPVLVVAVVESSVVDIVAAPLDVFVMAVPSVVQTFVVEIAESFVG